MFFTTNLVIASLATISAVQGFDKSAPRNGRRAVPEPQVASNFQIYDIPVDVSHVLGERRGKNIGIQDKVRIALAFLRETHNIQAENVKITDANTDESTGLSHVYVRQTANGIDLLNCLANVNIDNYGRVISFSQSFAPIHEVRKATRSFSLTARTDQDASLKAALKSLSRYITPEIDDKALNKVHISTTKSDDARAPKFIIKGIPKHTAVDGMAAASQSIIQNADGLLVHVWDIVFQQKNHWWNARINTATGSVESLADWVLRPISSHAQHHRLTNDEMHENEDEDKKFELRSVSTSDALQSQARGDSYFVFPINVPDPAPSARQLVSNPATPASPLGWTRNSTTLGNNVWAQSNPSGGSSWKDNHRPQASSDGVFNYPIDLTKDPSTYVDAAITQLFYILNTMHDVFYLYGFTESAYNFQDDNFGKGGQGGDYVVAFAQDGQRFNDASFAVPPDGQHGVLRVSLFNLTSPHRDGSLENDLLTRLYALGITSRMTGGGTATCLKALESQGLQEGWADAVADWLSATQAISDFIVGRYVINNPRGIRSYPYSRSPRTNPLTYGSLATLPPDEHYIGEVWANILHNVMAALVDAYGWSNTALISASGGQGNVVFMHLLIDGLSIQPCNPTFLNARDAFIQADNNRYRGVHVCTLWRAFASRGMGARAFNYVNDFSTPAGC